MFAVPTTGSSTPSITACPGGETEDQFTNICVPDIVPNSPQFQIAPPRRRPSGDRRHPLHRANSGECIGLAEEQQAEGPIAVPHSEVSSSP